MPLTDHGVDTLIRPDSETPTPTVRRNEPDLSGPLPRLVYGHLTIPRHVIRRAVQTVVRERRSHEDT